MNMLIVSSCSLDCFAGSCLDRKPLKSVAVFSPACYRADYYESYWDYGHDNTTKRENMVQKHFDVKLATCLCCEALQLCITIVQVINVGKCIGTCQGVISKAYAYRKSQ